MNYVSERNWNYDWSDQATWVGGVFPTPNLSGGYHGILKQWWDYYGVDKLNWLLIAENNATKAEFKNQYPNKNFYTLDFYDNMDTAADFVEDLCNPSMCHTLPKFDMVITQATLEHLYDPYGAMKNMMSITATGGYIIIHTHPPGFSYHAFPRDYFRFFPDWFMDMPNTIKNLKLKELCTMNKHIFAVYQKVINNV